MATQAETKGQAVSYPFTRFHIFLYRFSGGLLGGNSAKAEYSQSLKSKVQSAIEEKALISNDKD